MGKTLIWQVVVNISTSYASITRRIIESESAKSLFTSGWNCFTFVTKLKLRKRKNQAYKYKHKFSNTHTHVNTNKNDLSITKIVSSNYPNKRQSFSFFLSFLLWKFIKIVQIINFNHIVTIFWDPIGLLEFFISPNSKTTKTHNLKIHFHFYFPQFSWQSN